MRINGVLVFRTNPVSRVLKYAAPLLICGLPALPAVSQQAQPSIAQIQQQFLSPPDDSKPMVRWWWFGPAVERTEIYRELQQMKADNFGGVELAFVYPQAVDDPARGLKNLPFHSPEMLDAVNYAQAEGRKLGLRVDLTLCSGWPYGGPATTISEAAGRLRVVALPLAPDSSSLPLLKLSDGENIISTSVATGTLDRWNASTAQYVSAAAPLQASNTARVALFFIASHTRQQVKRAAVQAEGYVLDTFSARAVATHLKAVGEPLLSAFGATPPYAIFSDSLEAYGADWTPALPTEFRKRRGYDLLPHLPDLVAGGSPAADQIRHDYGRTLTELVDENYLSQINTWAHEHHAKFRSQTYGEPAVSLASQRLVDLPEGEGPQWREFSTLRWATSANHLFGNKVTSGESFTWLHSPVFRATPLDMKAEADIDLIMGENQFIYHGWPYSPPQAGEPGWSLYAAAVFNDHNPWHPVMPFINSYVQRLSFLLRQGAPANQVALLLPTDDAWAGFSPGHVTVSGAMSKLLPPGLIPAILTAGYNLDFTDADSISRLGIQHPILVLPPTDRIPIDTLRKIDAWVKGGGKIMAVGHAPTLDSNGTSSSELRGLSQKLFNIETLIPDTSTLEEALHHAATPDLKLKSSDTATAEQLGFIRRRLPDADIYFIVNTSNRPFKSAALFSGNFKSVARWDPESGASTGDGIVQTADNSIDLELAPYESAVYVFSNQPGEQRTNPRPRSEILDLSHDWKVTFSSSHRTVTEETLTDWTASPATLHYSGEAVYHRDFTLAAVPAGPIYLQIDGGSALAGPASFVGDHVPLGADGLPDPKITLPGPGMHAYFDPPVHEAALVLINDQEVGALWHPPYRLEVTNLLRPGLNHLEIHVYNTALNAWSAQPLRDYRPLIEKYGDRFQMQNLDQVKPVASGILGDIRLTR
jgi:alpha-L-rhamnosidase